MFLVVYFHHLRIWIFNLIGGFFRSGLVRIRRGILIHFWGGFCRPFELFHFDFVDDGMISIISFPHSQGVDHCFLCDIWELQNACCEGILLLLMIDLHQVICGFFWFLFRPFFFFRIRIFRVVIFRQEAVGKIKM